MKALLVSISLTFGLLNAMQAGAQAPATAPAGTTGTCKDGTYYSGAEKRGACRGHKGVKEWYGAAAAAGTTPTAAPAAATPVATPAPAAPAPAMRTPKTVPATAAAAPRVAAAGGGAGQVWVNTRSKVFHCSSDAVYGKTKQGAYMSEADAIAKGNHAAHGKSCN